jgi:glycosyltransferase involved in cell wall biosynthesis
MRVLVAPAHVSLDPSLGSEMYWVDRLLNGLSAHGWSVTAVAMSAPPDIVATVTYRLVAAAERTSARGWDAVWDRVKLPARVFVEGRRQLRHGGADLLHHALPFSTSAFNLLALSQRGLPFVIGPVLIPQTTSDSLDFANWLGMRPGPIARALEFVLARASPVFEVLNRRTLQRASAIIATTTEAASFYRERAPNTRIVVIPPGVDRVENGRLRSEPGSEPIRIVAVGDLIPRKRFNVFIAALALLRAAGVEFSALIVGAGPSEADLARQARAMMVDVPLVGRLPRHQVFEEMALADVLVHVPASEPVGQVVLEAMACGLAVVSSATGIAVDLLRDGRGFIVDPLSADGVADQLRALASDRVLTRSVGDAARSYARTELSWDVVAARYARVFVDAVTTQQ